MATHKASRRRIYMQTETVKKSHNSAFFLVLLFSLETWSGRFESRHKKQVRKNNAPTNSNMRVAQLGWQNLEKSSVSLFQELPIHPSFFCYLAAINQIISRNLYFISPKFVLYLPEICTLFPRRVFLSWIFSDIFSYFCVFLSSVWIFFFYAIVLHFWHKMYTALNNPTYSVQNGSTIIQRSLIKALW